MKKILYSLVNLVALIILLEPTVGFAAADTTRPTISGATNTTVYLNQTFNPKKGVTAKDNVDGNITSLIGISGKVDTKKIGKYTLTYKVTDTAKNATTVKRVVTVKKDTTQPNITEATNKTAYLGYSFDAKSGVKATDNADGTITSKIKVTGQVNTKKEGTYKLKYSVTDKGKNTRTVTRVITVKKDKEKPKITGATNKSIYKGYSFDPKTSVTATDNVDGNITSKITISGKVNVNEAGIYKLQYTAKDKTGNKTTVTRTITVKKDMTKPQITGAGDKIMNYGTSFDPKSGVKATDNIDGTITSKMTITGSVNVRKVGTYKLVYSIKDKTNNKTTVTRKINVVDKVKPTLTGSGLNDRTFAIGIYDNFPPLSGGITAYDNADGNLTSEIKVEGEVNVDKAGTYTLIYSVTDKSGNKTIAERKVTVIDNIPPKISGADNRRVLYFEPFDPMEGVTSSDNNDGDLTSKVVVKAIGEKLNTSDLSLSGTFTYEYSVSDEAGNTTTVNRQVILTYREAEFFGTDDVKINLGERFDPLKGVTATDYSNRKDVTSLIEVSGDVDVNSIGTYSLTYRIFDKGFRTGMVRRITVVDNIPPVITGVQDWTVDQNSSLPNLLKWVEANDNIDGDLTRKITVDTQNVDTKTEGEYIVTYSVTDKMGNRAEVQSTITVKKVPVTEVRVSDINNIVKPGEEFYLSADVYPENASFSEVTSWESSDENVATIDEEGHVNALADGTVTFTATVDGIKDSTTISVSGRPDLRFFTGGWEADPSTGYLRVDKMDFDAINDGKVPVTIDSVKVYDPNGSSPEDLVKLGSVTSLAPSSRTNVTIDFKDGKGPLIKGGSLSIFATIPNGNTYEYSIKFR